MIDYEKLKQAHELADNSTTHYIRHIVSNLGHGFSLCHYLPDMPDILLMDMDDLIDKLTELTQPKPKYEVGQKIFTFINNSIIEGEIQEVKWFNSAVDSDQWYRLTLGNEDLKGGFIVESKIFPSRKLLIEAQIKYWQSMRLPGGGGGSYFGTIKKHHELNNDDCQHVDDGKTYFTNPPKTKCRKCGEFYR